MSWDWEPSLIQRDCGVWEKNFPFEITVGGGRLERGTERETRSIASLRAAGTASAIVERGGYSGAISAGCGSVARSYPD